MITWLYFPKSDRPPPLALQVVTAFDAANAAIDSDQFDLPSNEVLAHLTPWLRQAGFTVEVGKRAEDRIRVPVLFGLDGRLEKFFDADAYHPEAGFVLEVEAGRAVDNNAFLKDLFQACMMSEVYYLAIAVRRTYKKQKDFEQVCRFFDVLYASRRLTLPLRGILVVGY